MKGRIVRALPLVMVLAMVPTGSARAADFWDMVAANVSATVPGDLGVQYYVNTKVNGATVRASWMWPDSSGGVFVDSPDMFLAGTLDIYDRNGILVLQSPPNLTRSQLDSWAAANVAVIFNVLYPAGISELTGATDDNILASTTVSQNLFNKAKPFWKGRDSNAEAAKDEVAEANAEYQNLKVNDFPGRSASVVMGFAKAAESGFNYSFTVPYRTTIINDDLGSRSRFLGLEMAAKYPVKKWDKDEWHLGACVFGSAFALKTDNVKKIGNLKYGGGAFTSLNHDLGFATLGVGLDYRLAKAYMPASMNSDDIFFAQTADYVNHHSPVQTFSYGFNFGMPVAADVAAVNFEVIRSNFVSNDIPEGQKARTSVNLGFSCYPSETFELNLGVGRDYEVDKVESFGLRLGVIDRF